MPEFKIVVLEVNDFYNKLLSNYLDNNLKKLAVINGFKVQINSFTSYKDCSRNFDNNTTILFSDYYLGDGHSAPHVIEFVNSRLSSCKVVVVSQIQNLQTSVCTLMQGAYEFIKKDKKALFECRDLAETIILEKMSLIN